LKQIKSKYTSLNENLGQHLGHNLMDIISCKTIVHMREGMVDIFFTEQESLIRGLLIGKHNS